jgi:hypothetical protein
VSGRRWYNVGVVKIPHADRDVARATLGDRPDEDAFQDIVGADTDDEDDRFPVGSNCTYRAALTEAEARQFEEASNCRYVSEDVVVRNVSTVAPGSLLPGWRCRAMTGYWSTAPTDLPATNTKMCVHDGGSSSLVRSMMNFNSVQRAVFTSPGPPTGENYPGMDHASLCVSSGTPYGGWDMEAIMIDGNDSSTDAIAAQAVTWSVDNGAKVVSGSYTFGANEMPATKDALIAASSADIVFYFAAGNESLNVVRNPAQYSFTVPLSYVYSVGGYDPSSGYRWVSDTLGSNYHASMTGVAPSTLVRGLIADGREFDWQGTSAACPQVAGMCTRLIQGGVTARQAGAALAATCIDKGQGINQGGGWFNLQAAAAYLGIIPPMAVPVYSRVTSTVGGYGTSPYGVLGYGV